MNNKLVHCPFFVRLLLQFSINHLVIFTYVFHLIRPFMILYLASAQHQWLFKVSVNLRKHIRIQKVLNNDIDIFLLVNHSQENYCNKLSHNLIDLQKRCIDKDHAEEKVSHPWVLK